MLCSCHYGPALSRFWFQTDLGRKKSASFLKLQAGKTFSSMVMCWSCSTSNFCTLIGQNLTGEFIWKIYAASWKLFYSDSWSWQTFVSTCDVSTGCTKWNTATIKGLLFSMAGLFIVFLVEKCVACQNWVIRFRMASFSFFTLPNA